MRQQRIKANVEETLFLPNRISQSPSLPLQEENSIIFDHFTVNFLIISEKNNMMPIINLDNEPIKQKTKWKRFFSFFLSSPSVYP
jgi:hypothetical protein